MIHLIKLSVGTDSIEDLASWQTERLAQMKAAGEKKLRLFHRTGQKPKRETDLLDGGSIYWVIKGQIASRQDILDVRPFTDPAGVSRCNLVLEPTVIPVAPRRLRPFQGWRYLPAHEAPPDLRGGLVEVAEMPDAMRKELRDLGLL